MLKPRPPGQSTTPTALCVRRWVPELADVPAAVHEPWKWAARERAALDYPDPVVGLADGLARFRQARGRT